VADKIVPEDNILTTAQVSLKLYQQMEDEQFKQKLRQVFTDVQPSLPSLSRSDTYDP
jgi:23S rRNA U2552 (ribose-2'-O)-methylase RlmE/FtsJ